MNHLLPPLSFLILLTATLAAPVKAQTTQPAVKTGTINLDGTDYRYTLTPTAATPPTSPPPAPAVPAFKMLPFSPVAPATAHVNAIDVPLPSGTLLSARYDWDFGDGSPKLRGWTAAHVYDAPGTYTLSLTITDDTGAVTTHTATVTIRPDARRTWHVAADGDDANPGTPDRPIRSFARAASAIGNNTRVLFRRGDRFDVPDPFAIAVKHKNVVIGAYGDETKPRPVLWKLPNTKESIVITMFKPAADVVIQDLCFDGPFAPGPDGRAPKIRNNAVHAAGDNVTVRRCLFLNVGDAANTERKVTGFLFEGNSAPLDYGVRGYMVWGQGSDHVYLNNTFANSTREHGFRVFQVNRMLVAGNTMANLDRRNVDKDDMSKGCIEIQTASYAYVIGNRVTGGPIRTGPRGGETEPADTAMDWGVIEGNTSVGVTIAIKPGTHHVAIRDNVVYHDEGIGINKPDGQGRTTRDIHIDHNTVVAPGERATLLFLEGYAEQISLTNNLLVAPRMNVGINASAAVYVGGRDLSCFTRVEGNVWPVPAGRLKLAGNAGLFYVAPKWGEPTGYLSLDQWRAFPQVKGDVAERVDVDQNGRPNTTGISGRAGALQFRNGPSTTE